MISYHRRLGAEPANRCQAASSTLDDPGYEVDLAIQADTGQMQRWLVDLVPGRATPRPAGTTRPGPDRLIERQSLQEQAPGHDVGEPGHLGVSPLVVGRDDDHFGDSLHHRHHLEQVPAGAVGVSVAQKNALSRAVTMTGRPGNSGVPLI